ncbi:MAG: hypothetical protein ABIH71_08235, partial [Candidatus Omnitrophota bacterium]
LNLNNAADLNMGLVEAMSNIGEFTYSESIEYTYNDAGGLVDYQEKETKYFLSRDYNLVVIDSKTLKGHNYFSIDEIKANEAEIIAGVKAITGEADDKIRNDMYANLGAADPDSTKPLLSCVVTEQSPMYMIMTDDYTKDITTEHFCHSDTHEYQYWSESQGAISARDVRDMYESSISDPEAGVCVGVSSSHTGGTGRKCGLWGSSTKVTRLRTYKSKRDNKIETKFLFNQYYSSTDEDEGEFEGQAFQITEIKSTWFSSPMAYIVAKVNGLDITTDIDNDNNMFNSDKDGGMVTLNYDLSLKGDNNEGCIRERNTTYDIKYVNFDDKFEVVSSRTKSEEFKEKKITLKEEFGNRGISQEDIDILTEEQIIEKPRDYNDYIVWNVVDSKDLEEKLIDAGVENREAILGAYNEVSQDKIVGVGSATWRIVEDSKYRRVGQGSKRGEKIASYKETIYVETEDQFGQKFNDSVVDLPEEHYIEKNHITFIYDEYGEYLSTKKDRYESKPYFGVNSDLLEMWNDDAVEMTNPDGTIPVLFVSDDSDGVAANDNALAVDSINKTETLPEEIDALEEKEQVLCDASGRGVLVTGYVLEEDGTKSIHHYAVTYDKAGKACYWEIGDGDFTSIKNMFVGQPVSSRRMTVQDIYIVSPVFEISPKFIDENAEEVTYMPYQSEYVLTDPADRPILVIGNEERTVNLQFEYNPPPYCSETDLGSYTFWYIDENTGKRYELGTYSESYDGSVYVRDGKITLQYELVLDSNGGTIKKVVGATTTLTIKHFYAVKYQYNQETQEYDTTYYELVGNYTKIDQAWNNLKQAFMLNPRSSDDGEEKSSEYNLGPYGTGAYNWISLVRFMHANHDRFVEEGLIDKYQGLEEYGPYGCKIFTHITESVLSTGNYRLVLSSTEGYVDEAVGRDPRWGTVSSIRWEILDVAGFSVMTWSWADKPYLRGNFDNLDEAVDWVTRQIADLAAHHAWYDTAKVDYYNKLLRAIENGDAQISIAPGGSGVEVKVGSEDVVFADEDEKFNNYTEEYCQAIAAGDSTAAANAWRGITERADRARLEEEKPSVQFGMLRNSFSGKEAAYYATIQTDDKERAHIAHNFVKFNGPRKSAVETMMYYRPGSMSNDHLWYQSVQEFKYFFGTLVLCAMWMNAHNHYYGKQTESGFLGITKKTTTQVQDVITETFMDIGGAICSQEIDTYSNQETSSTFLGVDFDDLGEAVEDFIGGDLGEIIGDLAETAIVLCLGVVLFPLSFISYLEGGFVSSSAETTRVQSDKDMIDYEEENIDVDKGLMWWVWTIIIIIVAIVIAVVVTIYSAGTLGAPMAALVGALCAALFSAVVAGTKAAMTYNIQHKFDNDSASDAVEAGSNDHRLEEENDKPDSMWEAFGDGFMDSIYQSGDSWIITIAMTILRMIPVVGEIIDGVYKIVSEILNGIAEILTQLIEFLDEIVKACVSNAGNFAYLSYLPAALAQVLRMGIWGLRWCIEAVNNYMLASTDNDQKPPKGTEKAGLSVSEGPWSERFSNAFARISYSVGPAGGNLSMQAANGAQLSQLWGEIIQAGLVQGAGMYLAEEMDNDALRIFAMVLVQALINDMMVKIDSNNNGQEIIFRDRESLVKENAELEMAGYEKPSITETYLKDTLGYVFVNFFQSYCTTLLTDWLISAAEVEDPTAADLYVNEETIDGIHYKWGTNDKGVMSENERKNRPENRFWRGLISSAVDEGITAPMFVLDVDSNSSNFGQYRFVKASSSIGGSGQELFTALFEMAYHNGEWKYNPPPARSGEGKRLDLFFNNTVIDVNAEYYDKEYFCDKTSITENELTALINSGVVRVVEGKAGQEFILWNISGVLTREDLTARLRDADVLLAAVGQGELSVDKVAAILSLWETAKFEFVYRDINGSEKTQDLKQAARNYKERVRGKNTFNSSLEIDGTYCAVALSETAGKKLRNVLAQNPARLIISQDGVLIEAAVVSVDDDGITIFRAGKEGPVKEKIPADKIAGIIGGTYVEINGRKVLVLGINGGQTSYLTEDSEGKLVVKTVESKEFKPASGVAWIDFEGMLKFVDSNFERYLAESFDDKDSKNKPEKTGILMSAGQPYNPSYTVGSSYYDSTRLLLSQNGSKKRGTGSYFGFFGEDWLDALRRWVMNFIMTLRDGTVLTGPGSAVLEGGVPAGVIAHPDFDSGYYDFYQEEENPIITVVSRYLRPELNLEKNINIGSLISNAAYGYSKYPGDLSVSRMWQVTGETSRGNLEVREVLKKTVTIDGKEEVRFSFGEIIVIDKVAAADDFVLMNTRNSSIKTYVFFGRDISEFAIVEPRPDVERLKSAISVTETVSQSQTDVAGALAKPAPRGMPIIFDKTEYACYVDLNDRGQPVIKTVNEVFPGITPQMRDVLRQFGRTIPEYSIDMDKRAEEEYEPRQLYSAWGQSVVAYMMDSDVYPENREFGTNMTGIYQGYQDVFSDIAYKLCELGVSTVAVSDIENYVGVLGQIAERDGKHFNLATALGDEKLFPELSYDIREKIAPYFAILYYSFVIKTEFSSSLVSGGISPESQERIAAASNELKQLVNKNIKSNPRLKSILGIVTLKTIADVVTENMFVSRDYFIKRGQWEQLCACGVIVLDASDSSQGAGRWNKFSGPAELNDKLSAEGIFDKEEILDIWEGLFYKHLEVVTGYKQGMGVFTSVQMQAAGDYINYGPAYKASLLMRILSPLTAVVAGLSKGGELVAAMFDKDSNPRLPKDTDLTVPVPDNVAFIPEEEGAIAHLADSQKIRDQIGIVAIDDPDYESKVVLLDWCTMLAALEEYYYNTGLSNNSPPFYRTEEGRIVFNIDMSQIREVLDAAGYKREEIDEFIVLLFIHESQPTESQAIAAQLDYIKLSRTLKIEVGDKRYNCAVNALSAFLIINGGDLGVSADQLPAVLVDLLLEFTEEVVGEDGQVSFSISMLGMFNAAKELGIDLSGKKFNTENLTTEQKQELLAVLVEIGPFIAHFDDHFVTFLGVDSEGNVIYLDNGKTKIVEFDKFLELWTGNALISKDKEIAVRGKAENLDEEAMANVRGRKIDDGVNDKEDDPDNRINELLNGNPQKGYNENDEESDARVEIPLLIPVVNFLPSKMRGTTQVIGPNSIESDLPSIND